MINNTKWTHFLVFILSTQFLFAQKCGKVEYKLQNTKDMSSLKNSNIKGILEAKIAQSESFHFTLRFKNNISVYKNTTPKNVFFANHLEQEAFKNTSKSEKADYDFYYQNPSQKKAMHKDALVVNWEEELFFWKITKETKKIGKYKAIKAIAELKSLSPFKKRFEIEVWFTPEIPLPYGPKNFNGLPGLVLEASMGLNKYYATNIELKNNCSTFEDISIPTENIVNMSLRKFRKIELKTYQDHPLFENMLKKHIDPILLD